MKRICALIVCMTVCGAALFAQTKADFDTKAEGGGVVITEYMGPGGNVVIPAAIGGKAVMGIGEYAFYECSGLSSVTIPGSVTTIGEEAFAGCTSLSSITIPASVTSIGNYVFFYCSSLRSITLSALKPPALGGSL